MPTSGATHRLILGRCRYSQANFTRFEPLLWSSGDAWTVVRDALVEFPEVGTVFGLEPIALNAAIGSLWVFATETNTHYEPGRRHDQLLARNIRPATQVIDYSRMELEAARRELVEVGVSASEILSRDIVVGLANGLCATLALLGNQPTGRLRADDRHLDDLELLRYDPSIAAGAMHDGARFVVPGREPSEIVEYVDWSPDSVFLERTLKKIRKLLREDRPAAEFMVLSTNAIEMLAGYLRRNGAPIGVRDPLHRMRKRLEDFLPNLEATRDDVGAIVTLLEDYRPVADRLSVDLAARRVEIDSELRQSLEPIVRAQIEENHATAITELNRIRTAITEATERHGQLHQDIEILRGTEHALITALTDALGGIHDAVESASGDTSGILPAIVHAVGTALGHRDPRSNLVPTPIPPWGAGARTEAAEIGYDRLRERLDAEAGPTGIDASSLTVLDVLLRAGELVVLCNPHDRILLDTYAHVVAGGRTRKLVLDPTIIGLDDLWRQPGSGMPTALAKAWTAAQLHPDRTILCVLEGLDAAPLRWWLRALVTELHSPNRPRNLLLAATVDTARAVNADDLNVLHGAVIPLVAEHRSEAWMRCLLAKTARRTVGRSTMLAARFEPSLEHDQTTALISALTDVPNVNSDAALRALRVFVAARPTVDGDASLRIAIDIARLASMAPEVAVTVSTPCITSGIVCLRERASGSST